jgi:hypothetical protein
MARKPGRPRKRAPKPAGARPTDAPTVEFTKKSATPGVSNTFGFECYNCGHYETMPGGRQQMNIIHNKALTHRCGQEDPDSWKKRKDIYG